MIDRFLVQNLLRGDRHTAIMIIQNLKGGLRGIFVGVAVYPTNIPKESL
jgi:hypothetical protein